MNGSAGGEENTAKEERGESEVAGGEHVGGRELVSNGLAYKILGS